MHRFTRSLTGFLLASLFVSGMVGCSSGPEKRNAANPLDALRASEKTDRYRQSFWQDAADNKPELFAKGVKFCRQENFDASTYPNCEYLRGPAMIENTGKSLKKEERSDTSKGFGNINVGKDGDVGFQRGNTDSSTEGD